MQKYDIFLKGTITSISNISIVPPNSPDVEVGNGGKAKEVTVNPRYRPDGECIMVPIVPGSTLRGRMRRVLLATVTPYIEDKPSLGTYLYNAVGGIKGSESEETFDIVNRNERRKRNPIVALVGAGAPWDPSTLAVGDAIPVLDVVPHNVVSVRPDDFVRTRDVFEGLDESAVPEYLQRRAGTKKKVAATDVVTKLKGEWAAASKAGNTARMAALDLELEDAKSAQSVAKEEAGNSLQLPFAHRVLPAGIDMNQKMYLKGVTEVEAGLFFAMLSNFFEHDPLIGGKSDARHYGEIATDWEVSIRPVMGKKESLGRITAEAFEPIEYPERIKDMIGAWEAFARSGDLDISEVKRIATAAAADSEAA